MLQNIFGSLVRLRNPPPLHFEIKHINNAFSQTSLLPERNRSGSSARVYRFPQPKSSAAAVFWHRAQGRREQTVPVKILAA